MQSELFLHIVKVEENHFKQRTNVANILDLTAPQKVVGSFQMLAYGVVDVKF